MTWTKLGDDFTDRPEIADVESRSARYLHVEALVHCNRHLLDGRLPRRALRKVTDSETLEDDIAALEAAGLWAPWPDGEGWQIDWADQERAEDVRARQESAKERQQRRRQHVAGDHRRCLPKFCKQAVTRDSTGDNGGDVTGVVTAPRTVPFRPGPEGPGRNREPRRCEHGRPLASDGAACQECAETNRSAVAS